MAAITRILEAIDRGDEGASEELLPLVYEELRELARVRLARERPGQTLQPTALVHEAYLRLAGGDDAVGWNSRGHFFASAAEAMRRILIDRARSRLAAKRGGGLDRRPLADEAALTEDDPESLIALHEALRRLEAVDAPKATLVKLRYFAGLTESQAAEAMGISRATAARNWAFARAWLYDEILRRRDAR